MPSEITAERLNEMASQWPREAREASVRFDEYGWWHQDGAYVPDNLAIAIHEAAAIKWLLDHGSEVRIINPCEGAPFIVKLSRGFDGVKADAPTLIEALHAAIMATAKEGA